MLSGPRRKPRDSGDYGNLIGGQQAANGAFSTMNFPRSNVSLGGGVHPLAGASGTSKPVSSGPKHPLTGASGTNAVRYQPDPLGRTPTGAGFGRGDQTFAPLPVGREYWNETNLQQNPDGTWSEVVPGRESRNPFDTAFNEEIARLQEQEQAYLDLIANYPQPSYVGGGGGGVEYGDMQAMIDSIVNSGLLTGGSTPYAMPEEFTPTLIDPSQLQTIDPVLIDPESIQRFNPELLEYADFDPLRQNVDSMKQLTKQSILDAFAPLSELRQPLQTSSGSIDPAATGLAPDVAGLAQAMGVGSDYDAQLAAANQDISAGAQEFRDAGALLDRVFNERRQGVVDVGDLSQANQLSDVEKTALMINAGLDVSELQDRRGVDASNVGARNQAEQDYITLINQIAMTNPQLQAEANRYNAGLLNDAYLQNIGLGNQAGQANVAARNETNMANTALENADRDVLRNLILTLINQSAGMGQTLDLSGLVA